MKHLVFLTLFATIILSGCCEPQIEFRDRWKTEVRVVPCKVKETECDWTGNNAVLSANMYACILQMKENQKVCDGSLGYNDIEK